MKKSYIGVWLFAVCAGFSVCAGESMLSVPWSYRVRGGAQGEVKIVQKQQITARRDNSAGQIVALSNKRFQVEPGATYRVSFTLTGPENGIVIPQAPIPDRRPFPTPGKIKTTGKEQTISFNVAVKPTEREMSAVIYFNEPGSYTVTGVTLDKISSAPAAGERLNGKWGKRIRGGAQGEVKMFKDRIEVRRDNEAGQILALSDISYPVESGETYRITARIKGPADGAVELQGPVTGRRPFPTTRSVRTTGQEQDITLNVKMRDADKQMGVVIYFHKPGNYTVSSVTVNKVSASVVKTAPAAAAKVPSVSGMECLNGKWGKRIRGGAQGEVKMFNDHIAVRRDNEAGQILVLSNRAFPVKPGATYRLIAKVTGPVDGAVELQGPVTGRRPFPTTRSVRTTGGEQEIALTVPMQAADKQISAVIYFHKPGNYTVLSVTLTEVSSPVTGKALKADAEFLAGKWRTGYHGNAAGDFKFSDKQLAIEVFDTLGSGFADLTDHIVVKPETRYRLLLDINGSGKVSISVPVFGDKNSRTLRAGYLGCNGHWETLKYDFKTGKGESKISLSFIFTIGRFKIRSIRLIETDPNDEFAADQKEFMVVWRSGSNPEADPVYSEKFQLNNGRFTGKLAVLLGKAYPEHKLKFESGYRTSDNVKAEIVVRDVNKQIIYRAAVTDAGVLLPEQAAYTFLELTAPANGAAYREFTVRDDISAPEAFHWRQWNSYEVGNPAAKATLYRVRFKLDKSPVGALGRFLTSGRVGVNGKELGAGVTHDSSDCYRNLLPHLKTGDNEITVNMSNPRHQGMQTDILIGFADGTHKVIRGDDGSWEMQEHGSDKWVKVPVKKSAFRSQYFQQRWISPGEIPDRVVQKVKFSGKAEFASTGLRGQKRLPVNVEMDIKEWMFLGANRFDISVVDSAGKSCWRQTVFGEKHDFVKGFKGKLNFRMDLCTEFLPPGTYHLETPEFLCGKITGNFTVLEACKPQIDFSVDYSGYLPMFKVNGKYYPVAIYRHLSRFKIGRENYFLHDFWRGMQKDGEVKFHIANAEMGPDAHKNAGVCSGEMWTGPGQYNFGILDRMFENILAVDPDSLIMLSVNIDAPQWYLKTYPGTRAIWHTGELSGGVSWASTQWRRDSVAAARAMMSYVNSRPYASRIVGVFFSGGYDGQWFHHLSWRHFPYKVTDYNPEMLAYFRGYLRRIYGDDVKKLQAAWHDQSVNFENAQIPTFEQRRGQGYYLDHAKGERRIIDFMDAQAEVLKTHLDELFMAAKSENPKLIAGSYYVPNWDCTYRWGQVQRQITDQMFDSPWYDFGAAPMDYTWRNIDEVGHTRFGRNQYYHVNKKLELLEDDNRTFKFAQMPVSSWGNYTPGECVDTMRRNYAQRLSLGAGVWYYDIFGAFFDTPLLLRIIREEQILWRASNEFKAVPELNAQATVLRRIGDFNNRRMTTNADLSQTHYWRRLERFGYPVDDSLVRDLGNPRQPEYKLYLIDDIICLTDAERKKIDALKKDGNILVFQHVAGYSDGKSLSAQHISDVVGINIIEDRPGEELSDLSWTFSDASHMLLDGLRGKKALRTKEYRAKRFAVKDSGAVALGYFNDGGSVAAAIKKYPDWTAVYLPTRLPPFAFQDNLAKFAKIHVFTEAPVAFRAGGRFMSVYCLEEQASGTVKLPKAFALYDVFANKIIAPVEKVDFKLRQGDTKLWFAGTLDEVEKFAQMVRKSNF
ncbi:MAG: hypothetical protein IKA71_09135 [Lentisphaeria bacterium]|nr:hypothetical protein [Lentisphaeria bacterium]